MKGFFKSENIKKQIFYLILILLLTSLLSYLFIFSILAFNGFPNITNLQSEETIFILKIMQICYSVGIFILAPLFFIYTTKHIIFKKKIIRQQIILTACTIIILIPFVNFLASWNENIIFPEILNSIENWIRYSESKASSITEAFLKMDTIYDLIFNIVIIALIPSIGEELLFRGVIQKLFLNFFNNAHLSVILTAILFSAIHFQFLGFFPRCFLGIILGYIYIWGSSIYLPIIAHFINNATAIIIVYLINNNQISSNIETIGSNGGGIVLISFFGSLILLYLLRQISVMKT